MYNVGDVGMLDSPLLVLVRKERDTFTIELKLIAKVEECILDIFDQDIGTTIAAFSDGNSLDRFF